MFRTLWIALLAVGVTTLAGAAAAAPVQPDRVVLPIVDFVFGAPVIEVRLNGGEAHRFKFDSGSMELMDGQQAALEGIKATGITKLLEINKAETMPVSDTDVRLGDLDIGPVSLALMPPGGWAHPARIDGMIGKSLLLRYVVTMDVPGRQIVLTRPDAYEIPEGATILPMVEFHGLFHVPATLDGHPGEFGLDTGLTSHVLVFAAFEQANALALQYGDNVISGDAAGTTGVKSKVRQAKGDGLILGEVMVAGPQVLLLGQQDGVGGFDQIAGLIGMPVLTQFTVTFDAPHKRLVLESARAPAILAAPIALDSKPEAEPAISAPPEPGAPVAPAPPLG
jgi:hypothetical protein